MHTPPTRSTTEPEKSLPPSKTHHRPADPTSLFPANNDHRPEFVVISRSGVIQRWDMAGHTCLATRTIDKARGGTIAYSRDGSFLVVGLEAGLLHIVDSQVGPGAAQSQRHRIRVSIGCFWREVPVTHASAALQAWSLLGHSAGLCDTLSCGLNKPRSHAGVCVEWCQAKFRKLPQVCVRRRHDLAAVSVCQPCSSTLRSSRKLVQRTGRA